MKKSKRLQNFIVCFILACCLLNNGYAQLQYVKATNANCYYWTDPASTFTWSGRSVNRYCNGYGTLQFYDKQGNKLSKYIGNVRSGKNEGYGITYYSNGMKAFEGYWKNDERNGYGTHYDDSAEIIFQGYYKNGAIKDASSLTKLCETKALETVDQVFNGGQNIQYTIKKAIYSVDGKLQLLWIKTTFDGDVVSSNHYDCTIVVDLKNNTSEVKKNNQLTKDYVEMREGFSKEFLKEFCKMLLQEVIATIFAGY